MDASQLARSALTHAEYSVSVLKTLVEALESAVSSTNDSSTNDSSGPTGPIKTNIQAPLEPELVSIKEWDKYFRDALDVLLSIKKPAARRAALIEMKGLVEQAITAIDNNERIKLDD